MRWQRSSVPVVLVVAAVVTLAALIGAPASAHTGLVASTPSEGDRVGADVSRVVLVFGAPLDPRRTEVVVQDGDGRTVSHGGPSVSGADVEQSVRVTAPGVHTVGYRVVGLDGHAVVGSFDFTVTGTTAPPTAPPEQTPRPLSAGNGFDVAVADPGEGVPLPHPVVLVLAVVALALLAMRVGGHRARGPRAGAGPGD